MENRLRQYSSADLVYEIFGGFWVWLGCDKILSVKFMVTTCIKCHMFLFMENLIEVFVEGQRQSFPDVLQNSCS